MKLDIAQLEFIDRKLRDILVELEKQVGVEFTITSLYRIGDHGVHGSLPLRGADLRVRSASVGEELESLVNFSWKYDSERPSKNCAILHGIGSGLHLHIQVHPNTQRSGGD